MATIQKKKVKELTGNIYWIYPAVFKPGSDKPEILKGFLSSIETTRALIRFSCVIEGNKYDAVLKSTNGINYNGVADCVDAEDEVKMYMTLYKNEKGFILFGDWIEDKDYTCVVEVMY